MLTLLLWSCVFVLVGAFLYNADSYYGTSWYRSWYNATHGESLPENTRKGFIVGRSSRSRFILATTAVLLKVAATILIAGGLHPLYEFLMWPVEVISLVLGFYLGPFVYEQWMKKDKAFAYLDKVESGEVNVTRDLKEGVKSVGNKAISRAVEVKMAVLKGGGQPKENTVKSELVASKPDNTQHESKIDPMDAVKKFTDRF